MVLISFRILVIFLVILFQLRSVIKQNIDLASKKKNARISKILFNVKLKAVALRIPVLLGFREFSWVAALSSF